MSAAMYEQWRTALNSIWSHQFDGSVPRQGPPKDFSEFGFGSAAANRPHQIHKQEQALQEKGGCAGTGGSRRLGGDLGGQAVSGRHVKTNDTKKVGSFGLSSTCTTNTWKDLCGQQAQSFSYQDGVERNFAPEVQCFSIQSISRSVSPDDPPIEQQNTGDSGFVLAHSLDLTTLPASPSIVTALRCVLNPDADDAELYAARAMLCGDDRVSAGEMPEGEFLDPDTQHNTQHNTQNLSSGPVDSDLAALDLANQGWPYRHSRARNAPGGMCSNIHPANPNRRRRASKVKLLDRLGAPMCRASMHDSSCPLCPHSAKRQLWNARKPVAPPSCPVYETVEERWALQPCGPEKGHCPGLPEVEPSLPSYIIDTADIDTRL